MTTMTCLHHDIFEHESHCIANISDCVFNHKFGLMCVFYTIIIIIKQTMPCRHNIILLGMAICGHNVSMHAVNIVTYAHMHYAARDYPQMSCMTSKSITLYCVFNHKCMINLFSLIASM